MPWDQFLAVVGGDDHGGNCRSASISSQAWRIAAVKSGCGGLSPPVMERMGHRFVLFPFDQSHGSTIRQNDGSGGLPRDRENGGMKKTGCPGAEPVSPPAVSGSGVRREPFRCQWI